MMAKVYVVCVRTMDGEIIHGVFSDEAKAVAATEDPQLKGCSDAILEFDLDEVGCGEDTGWRRDHEEPEEVETARVARPPMTDEDRMKSKVWRRFPTAYLACDELDGVKSWYITRIPGADNSMIPDSFPAAGSPAGAWKAAAAYLATYDGQAFPAMCDAAKPSMYDEGDPLMARINAAIRERNPGFGW